MLPILCVVLFPSPVHSQIPGFITCISILDSVFLVTNPIHLRQKHFFDPRQRFLLSMTRSKAISKLEKQCHLQPLALPLKVSQGTIKHLQLPKMCNVQPNRVGMERGADVSHCVENVFAAHVMTTCSRSAYIQLR